MLNNLTPEQNQLVMLRGIVAELRGERGNVDESRLRPPAAWFTDSQGLFDHLAKECGQARVHDELPPKKWEELPLIYGSILRIGEAATVTVLADTDRRAVDL